MHILAGGLSRVTISNSNLRITLVQNGPDNSREEAGTLIIPISQAAPFINAIGNSLKALNEQLARQQEAQENKNGMLQ